MLGALFERVGSEGSGMSRSSVFLPRLISFATLIGALCGAFAILLGSVVLLGWAVHSAFLVQVRSDLPAMERITAVSLALSGVGLLGIVTGRQRFTFIGSAISASFAAASLLGSWFPQFAGQMPPATALCFILLAAVFVLSHVTPMPAKSSLLGVAGLLVAAVGSTCAISVFWGRGDAFGLGIMTRMALFTAGGLVALGSGAVAAALGMSQAELRQPAWAPVGATVFLAMIRIGLLQAFSAQESDRGVVHPCFAGSAVWTGCLWRIRTSCPEGPAATRTAKNRKPKAGGGDDGTRASRAGRTRFERTAGAAGGGTNQGAGGGQ